MINLERKLISVHIEKTAGTSVQELLEWSLGARNVLIYSPLNDSLTRASDLRIRRTNKIHDALRYRIVRTGLSSFINKNYAKHVSCSNVNRSIDCDNLPKSFSAIHGHFTASRFDCQIKDPIRTVVIRRPLDRMKSQFNHWKDSQGTTDWRIRVPFDPKVSFEDFAFLPALKDFQSQALADKNLNDFEVVGVTDQLHLYATDILATLRNYKAVGNLGEHSLGWFNRTPRQDLVSSDANFMTRFESFHSLDYALYEEAQRRVLMTPR